MSCLSAADIYLYLENELDPAAAREADKHLALCPVCRNVFKERQALMDAVAGIPDLEVPPDLAQKILARIPSVRSSRIGGLATFMIGISTLALGGLAYAFLTRYVLTGFLIDAAKSAWGFIRDSCLAFIKFAKVAAFGLDLAAKFVAEMVKGLAHIRALISPEVYAGCLLFLIVLTAFLIAGVRKTLPHGEKP